MDSRMDKYYKSSNSIGRRSQKNEQLYQEVKKQTVEDFNVNSNVSVLSDNGTSINLDDLRQLLDQKYNSNKERKKLNFDISQTEEEIELEKTKEYDINAILEKAHENKTVDYQKERLKKIRDTQYDILKGLNLSKPDDEEEQAENITPEEQKLMSLINTITANELSKKNQSSDPLDLFEDLKGDDDTKVMGALSDQVKPFDTDKIKDVVKSEVKNQIDNSFYTKSFNLSKEDFEDFKDLQEDVKSNKIIITILTIIVIIAFLAGIFIFLNIYFNWGII